MRVVNEERKHNDDPINAHLEKHGMEDRISEINSNGKDSKGQTKTSMQQASSHHKPVTTLNELLTKSVGKLTMNP